VRRTRTLSGFVIIALAFICQALGRSLPLFEALVLSGTAGIAAILVIRLIAARAKPDRPESTSSRESSSKVDAGISGSA
jgi:hypothetical protein